MYYILYYDYCCKIYRQLRFAHWYIYWRALEYMRFSYRYDVVHMGVCNEYGAVIVC